MATIAPQPLIDFAEAVFRAHGVPEGDARLFAHSLVQADLWGHQSHGVLRLPRYLHLIGLGLMNPRPEIREMRETHASVVIEADRALGPIAMGLGMARAIYKVLTTGIGLGLVRNTKKGTRHTVLEPRGFREEGAPRPTEVG